MRVITSAMQTLLNSDSVDGLATFWKLTRKDSVVMGFTDWDLSVTVDGVTYSAATGYSRSAMQQRTDMAVPNVDVTGLLNDDAITDVDIRAGVYDGAVIEVFMAIATDTNFATYGTISLPGAYIGEIRIVDGIYTAELRGLAYALQQSFIEVYTPTCQAQFCDSRCKLTLASYTDDATVSTIATQRWAFTPTYSTTNGQNAWGGYINGVVTWTGGANIGRAQEVANWNSSTGELSLWLPTPHPITVGDTLTVSAGCDKSWGACTNFGNIVNYRGFNAIPGVQFLYDYGEITGP